MTQDPTPAAIKWALAGLGHCTPDVRSPITPWQPEDETLLGLMRDVGLISPLNLGLGAVNEVAARRRPPRRSVG